MATKYQKELSEFLGPDYSMKIIDGEDCIYRKLNAHYDIEISGTDRRGGLMNLYLWDISSGEGKSARLVKNVFGIRGRGHLESVLRDIIAEYSDLT